ncbi:MAG: type II secretion system GspH family protein, partial [Armatimonadetes bacterium]|nr:type II secretion system GspH family protein [Armatimonadota bacterium]
MRRGLTLMELLVVISILTTLAALLFPIYLNFRSQIEVNNCANQLYQIGLALKMYVNDYGGDTPYNVPPLLGALYPHYVRSRDLLVCPLFRKTAQNAVKFLNELHTGYGCPSPWSSY